MSIFKNKKNEELKQKNEELISENEQLKISLNEMTVTADLRLKEILRIKKKLAKYEPKKEVTKKSSKVAKSKKIENNIK